MSSKKEKEGFTELLAAYPDISVHRDRAGSLFIHQQIKYSQKERIMLVDTTNSPDHPIEIRVMESSQSTIGDPDLILVLEAVDRDKYKVSRDEITDTDIVDAEVLEAVKIGVGIFDALSVVPVRSRSLYNNRVSDEYDNADLGDALNNNLAVMELDEIDPRADFRFIKSFFKDREPVI